MAFDFGSSALVTSEQVSKFIFGVADATTDLPSNQALTASQIFSINLMVKSISSQIKRYTSSDIIASNYVEVWDGAASDELIPTAYPINSVASVKTSGNGDFSTSNPLPTEVVAFTKWSITFRGYRLPFGRGLIQVTYNAGYTEIPDEIVFATLLQFQWTYKKIGRGDAMVGLQSISKAVQGGSESQTKDANLSKEGGLIGEVVGILEPYRRLEAPLSIMFTRCS